MLWQGKMMENKKYYCPENLNLLIFCSLDHFFYLCTINQIVSGFSLSWDDPFHF